MLQRIKVLIMWFNSKVHMNTYFKYGYAGVKPHFSEKNRIEKSSNNLFILLELRLLPEKFILIQDILTAHYWTL